MTINCHHINLSIQLIPNKIPIKFFIAVENLILKFMYKRKCKMVAKTIFKNKRWIFPV